jgi:hypothetical protein
MTWLAERNVLVSPQALACWPCTHFARRVDESGGRMRCERSQRFFPTAGKSCSHYTYEPGSNN